MKKIAFIVLLLFLLPGQALPQFLGPRTANVPDGGNGFLYSLIIGSGFEGDTPPSKGLVVEGSAWFSGGMAARSETFTISHTVTLNDYTCRLDGSSVILTATLPTAASAYDSTTKTGAIFNFKCVNADNQVAVAANGAETIDGENQWILSVGDNLKVQSNGVSWDIL